MPQAFEQVSTADDDEDDDRRRKQVASNVCVFCLGGSILSMVVGTAIARHQGCDPAVLSELPPPYGGELLPNDFYMQERRSWFQWSKVVDVYDRADQHVGYFYDMNLFVIMRFGYSDSQDRIWFEASRYPFYKRIFMFGDNYYLQRCDVGAGGRHGHTYECNEQYWNRPWFCWSGCFKEYTVTSHPDRGYQSENSALVSDVKFYSKVVFQQQGLSAHFRHMWHADVNAPNDGPLIASAHQDFRCAPALLGCMWLSVWVVNISNPGGPVPNWVVGFMAALEDIEENKE